MLKVWRVEDRRNPDAVDFWDFLDKNEAEKWYEEESILPWDTEEGSEQIIIRQLTDQEVIDTALSFYEDSLKTSEY